MLRSKGLSRIAFLLLLHSCLAAQAAQDRIAPIISALQNQQFDEALGLLHAALKESPGNSQLWTMQGVAYAGESKKDEALDSFRRALKISPDNVPTRNL